MRLFLDSSSRVFRGQVPDGASTIPSQLTAGTVELDVSDDDWNNIYYPAWAGAFAADQDLVIDVFGGTNVVSHTPTAQEQAISTLLGFPLTGTPTLAQADDAIRAIIVLLELSGTLSQATVPAVVRMAAPIRQTTRRVTRARSRAVLVSGGTQPAPSLPPRMTRGVNRKPPLKHRRGKPR